VESFEHAQNFAPLGAMGSNNHNFISLKAMDCNRRTTKFHHGMYQYDRRKYQSNKE